MIQMFQINSLLPLRSKEKLVKVKLSNEKDHSVSKWRAGSDEAREVMYNFEKFCRFFGGGELKTYGVLWRMI
jgi:hypothetical protein